MSPGLHATCAPPCNGRKRRPGWIRSADQTSLFTACLVEAADAVDRALWLHAFGVPDRTGASAGFQRQSVSHQRRPGWRGFGLRVFLAGNSKNTGRVRMHLPTPSRPAQSSPLISSGSHGKHGRPIIPTARIGRDTSRVHHGIHCHPATLFFLLLLLLKVHRHIIHTAFRHRHTSKRVGK